MDCERSMRELVLCSLKYSRIERSAVKAENRIAARSLSSRSFILYALIDKRYAHCVCVHQINIDLHEQYRATSWYAFPHIVISQREPSFSHANRSKIASIFLNQFWKWNIVSPAGSCMLTQTTKHLKSTPRTPHAIATYDLLFQSILTHSCSSLPFSLSHTHFHLPLVGFCGFSVHSSAIIKCRT